MKDISKRAQSRENTDKLRRMTLDEPSPSSCYADQVDALNNKQTRSQARNLYGTCL